MATFVLAGDVGGTKTDLALYRVEGVEQVALVREASFPSREYSGLEAIATEFLREHDGGVLEAAFGVAGPVIEEKVQVTNLPWKVEAESLAAEIGCQGVRLMNDLETTAYGALFLKPDELVTLNEGISRRTHRAVIAAGTGLGQAILFWDGQRYRPTATEGGHAAFAPRDEREMGLLRFLIGRHGRVSFERVLSGPGLSNIFDYLREELSSPVAPGVLERMKTTDPNAVIGQAALAGTCPTCEEAVDLFVSLYGAQAGNLALTTMALGGVYIGGGIVTKLLPKVKAGGFMEAFVDVGRFESLMRETPVHVILNPKTSLLGAAEAALDLALEQRAIQTTR
jgi:glucokinase